MFIKIPVSFTNKQIMCIYILKFTGDALHVFIFTNIKLDRIVCLCSSQWMEVIVSTYWNNSLNCFHEL